MKTQKDLSAKVVIVVQSVVTVRLLIATATSAWIRENYMSREYIVLMVDIKDEESGDIDGAYAKVFMRFTEEPDGPFLQRLAESYPGKRIYSLMGASSWYYSAKM